MFENIVGQTSVTSRLAGEVRSKVVAPALLFTGPDFTGKGTTALELARALTCTGGNDAVPWSCRCHSCVQQRYLTHPETLLLGGRAFVQEIRTAGAALLRENRTPLRFLFTRAVRKLARRYDHVLWEEDEQTLSKVESILLQLDDALSPLEPDAEGAVDAKAVSSVIDVCRKLVAVRNLDAVPVDVIRRLSVWSHIAFTGPAKVAIIERIDRLQESARNALLKTLEEPPAGVYFILTARRRGSVMATITSRARHYEFEQRPPQEAAEVIERIFRDRPDGVSDLRGYFLGEVGASLRAAAEAIWSSVSSGGSLDAESADAIAAASKEVGAPVAYRRLSEELIAAAHASIRRDPGSAATIRRAAAWRALVAERLERVETYRIDPATALESLCHAAREQRLLA